MNQDILKLEMLNELRTQVKIRCLEIDLIENFDFAFNWVMGIAQRNGLELPNKERMSSCLEHIQNLMDEIYGKTPDSEHPNRNTRRPNRTLYCHPL